MIIGLRIEQVHPLLTRTTNKTPTKKKRRLIQHNKAKWSNNIPQIFSVNLESTRIKQVHTLLTIYISQLQELHTNHYKYNINQEKLET